MHEGRVRHLTQFVTQVPAAPAVGGGWFPDVDRCGQRRAAARPGRRDRAAASLLDGIGDSGGALVLSGEPGIGKSRLLAVAAEFARERGLMVLSTTGPSWASRIHRVAAASPSRDSVGFCTMLTRNPSRVSDS